MDYDKYLNFFLSIMADANPANMQRKDVIRMRDANADKPYFANYSLRVLRVLMEHCVDLGWRETNPAKGCQRSKPRGQGVSRGPVSYSTLSARRVRLGRANGS